MQVNDALEPYAHAMHVSLRLVAGGLSMSKQVQALNRGVHMLVATPGRLADLVRRGNADLTDVSLIVLDEADHMAEMGFMDEITEILANVPAGGQRLLFSATLDGDVDRLVSAYMNNPARHDVTDGDDDTESMTHVGLNVPPHLKYQIANRIVSREGRTIVFVRTKLGCDRIAGQMREAGVNAVALHGDKSQVERNQAISGFRAGTIPVLVATDVAARGIHVDSVDLVMQIDPPADHKDYTHRAGRTARAGKAGMVVTLVLPHQRKTVDRIFEGAGVDPLFRKIRGDDSESMAMVDMLTGGHEPSGVPVPEPQAPRAERGRGRPERGGPRGRSEGARRPSRGMSDGGRWDARREDSGSSRARDEMARKERDLADRERQLAMREQELDTRATKPEARNDAPQRDRGSSDRPSYGRPDRSSGGSDRPSYGRPERSGGRPDRSGGRPDRSGGRPERSGGRPERSSGGSDRPSYGRPERSSGGSDRPSYGRPERSGGRPDRSGGRPERSGGRPDRSSGGSDRPSYGRPERSGGRPDRSSGGSDRPSYGRPERSGGRPDRSSGGSDRPSYGRPERSSGGSDRPSYGRPERSSGGSDRPSYGRPERSNGGSDRNSSRPNTAGGARNERSGGSDQPESNKPFRSKYFEAKKGSSSNGKKGPKKANRSGKPRPKKK